MRTASVCAVALAGAMVALAVVGAQDQPQGQSFRADVSYVRVDMYPTIDGKSVEDLTEADVEVLEDGVPQTIAQFEHVKINGSRSQTTRAEPTTVAETRQASRDPRARLFVLFLDPRHVDGISSMQIRRPLIDALNRLIGGDDLVAVTTPALSARSLTFTRRTTSIENLLSKYWAEKEWLGTSDPIELKYESCYPEKPDQADIAPEMIRRHREKQTLGALEDLIEHLRALREERKAVMTISEGWPLYGPNPALRRPLSSVVTMALPPLIADPRTGRPTAAEPSGLQVDFATCENDRVALSDVHHEERFAAIMQAANRGNTSFYPIDPRGFTAQSGSSQARASSLRTMADATDGLAIVNGASLDRGLQRIVDDLSSYYLLAYNSPARPDGRFHRITVRVKRPGVNVRARSGYLAAKVSGGPRPVAPIRSEVDAAEGRVVAQALGALAAFARERPLRVQAAAGWTPAGEAAIWIVAEVTSAAGDDWSRGGQVEVKLLDSSGAAIDTRELPLQAGAGPISARAVLKLAPTASLGGYQVQIRARGAAGALPSSETVRISVAAPPDGSGALFNRRGITTGNREAATADLRFRRSERLIVMMPSPSPDPVSARLLDRAGKALSIPVTASIRDESDGSRWRTAEATLAPLAAGDYLIELTAGGERTLTAFRVLP